MAMVASAMASSIIGNINQSSDAADANNKFYKALCDYVEANAQVFYAWSAVSPPPASTPDPMVVIQATIKTSGSLSPSGATECSAALAAFAATLNANAAIWQVVWPAGFALTPAFVIPTIVFTPSMVDNQQSAMTHICQEIINGLKAATPVASGSHAAYTGVASFTQLI